MYAICGADGCRGGWVVIYKDLDCGAVWWRFRSAPQQIAYSRPRPQVVAIDIPIGLPEAGPRACDVEARRLLGPGRASAIFPAPIRPVLAATGYDEACRIRLRVDGKKLSCQSWAITTRVREVDDLLRQDADLQASFHEVHPEVSFCLLAGGRPLQHSKKEPAGREERRKLLETVFGGVVQTALAERRELSSQEDDVLDAFVALWTAERIAQGKFCRLPSAPTRDSFGILMQILA